MDWGTEEGRGRGAEELDTRLWANEIDRHAMQTRRKGRQAVRTALAGHAPWRRMRGRSSAVERALAGARRKERGDVMRSRAFTAPSGDFASRAVVPGEWSG